MPLHSALGEWISRARFPISPSCLRVLTYGPAVQALGGFLSHCKCQHFPLHPWELCSWLLALGEKVTPKGALQSINDAWMSDRLHVLSVGPRSLSRTPKEVVNAVLVTIRNLEEWEVPPDVWFMRNLNA